MYNRAKLKNIASEFEPTSFVYNLQPFELVYLKTQKLSNVVNGTVNELIANGTIKVNSDNTIELVKSYTTNNNAQLQVTSVLSEVGRTSYPSLLIKLEAKPIFGTIANSINAFKKYFNKSKKFGRLFYTNFTVLAFLLLLALTRISTGVFREKPVVQIVIATIFLAVITVVFLQRLTKQMATTIIPNIYKNEILPTQQLENNWQWTYFLLGSAVLTTAFVPLVSYIDRNNSGSNSETSSGSSCGSSCSSCGGCCGD
ncbi:hypothetical protein GCM10011405_40020 [Rufibacter glacialis]|nr:hypothetical protein GCM10011405_40020 [Rufibacter glacialis]